MNMDKVERVLLMQEQGHDISEIAEAFNYTGYKGLQNYMRSKGYSCVEKKFIPKDDNVISGMNEVTSKVVQVHSVEIQGAKDQEEVKVKKTKSVSNNELKEQMEKVTYELERIKYYMIEEKSKHIFKLPTKLCDKGNPTSVRLYTDDKEAFYELCNTKFKDINKDALFSMAIGEFVEKYRDND